MVEDNINNGEVASHEKEVDPAKLPLNEGSVAVDIDDGKAGKNEVGEYRGLTKDELMVYANDPKWKRIRMALMFFFWAGWVAMLVVAIFIIVKAPSCAPPPTSTWLEKGALLELDIGTSLEEASGLMEKMSLSSLYIPNLISDIDFMNMKEGYVKEKVVEMIEGLVGLEKSPKHIVTDFVPSPIRHFHVWTQDAQFAHLYNDDFTLNYTNPAIKPEIEKIVEHWETEFNVTGFLVPGEDYRNSEHLRNLTHDLNAKFNPNVTFGESTFRVPSLDGLEGFAPFKSFIQDNTSDWRFFKVRPAEDEGQVSLMRLVLITLFTLDGTPVIEVPKTDVEVFSSNFTTIIREATKLREHDAIKFGETKFVTNTTTSAVAFTRTLKGTPGYAVAVNFDSSADLNVDLTTLEHVPEVGSFTLSVGDGADRVQSKTDMTKVELGPLSAVVIQFVANE